MIEYKVIKELSDRPDHTQRTLAESLDVSLGKINYVLTGLAEKGLIKMDRLRTEPGKIRWRYILTPQGILEKTEITRQYLQKRMAEFDEIQREIVDLKKEIGETV